MPKLTNRQKQAIDTKLKITERAMELFKLYGFESVRVKDICDSANISVGAFYHHFESKENIIENAYKHIDLIVAEETENLQCNSQTEKIVKIFDKANTFLEELGWHFIADSYKHMITASNKYSLSSTRYPYVSIKEAIEKGIKDGEFSSECNPEEVSEICMRVGRGMVFDWCLHEGKYSLTNESKKTILLYLNNYKIK